MTVVFLVSSEDFLGEGDLFNRCLSPFLFDGETMLFSIEATDCIGSFFLCVVVFCVEEDLILGCFPGFFFGEAALLGGFFSRDFSKH